ncbi:hypothetical protein BD779DRAFT_1670572 [Infundibulicybe gibba]|nr:hypothetical protein BD779DRAFT_1670572 [Infundibulicybe gibba]
MLSRVFLVLGTIAIIHGQNLSSSISTDIINIPGYSGLFYLRTSAFQHLTLGRPEGSLPQDVILETLLGLVLGILGASLNAPPLKEITWASEMRQRNIDEMDSRLGFASFVNRGRGILSQSPGSKQRS